MNPNEINKRLADLMGYTPHPNLEGLDGSVYYFTCDEITFDHRFIVKDWNPCGNDTQSMGQVMGCVDKFCDDNNWNIELNCWGRGYGFRKYSASIMSPNVRDTHVKLEETALSPQMAIALVIAEALEGGE